MLYSSIPLNLKGYLLTDTDTFASYRNNIFAYCRQKDIREVPPYAQEFGNTIYKLSKKNLTDEEFASATDKILQITKESLLQENTDKGLARVLLDNKYLGIIGIAAYKDGANRTSNLTQFIDKMGELEKKSDFSFETPLSSIAENAWYKAGINKDKAFRFIICKFANRYYQNLFANGMLQTNDTSAYVNASNILLEEIGEDDDLPFILSSKLLSTRPDAPKSIQYKQEQNKKRIYKLMDKKIASKPKELAELYAELRYAKTRFKGYLREEEDSEMMANIIDYVEYREGQKSGFKEAFAQEAEVAEVSQKTKNGEKLKGKEYAVLIGAKIADNAPKPLSKIAKNIVTKRLQAAKS